MAENGRGPEGDTANTSPEAEALTALLHDLGELRDYLAARGQHTYELAQRFLQNARRQSAESAYDERQATMLEYQHYIWHEIAGRLDQLLSRYSSVAPEPTQVDVPARTVSDEER